METNSTEMNEKILSTKLNKFINEKFKKVLGSLEKDRIEAKKRSIIFGIIGVIIAGIIIAFLCYKQTFVPEALIFILAIPVVLWNIPIQLYQKKAKELILPELLKFLGDFKLNNEQEVVSIIRNYVSNLKLFNRYNRYHSDDIITGKYKNLNVELAELSLEMQRSNGKHTTTETIFSGLLLMFKSFKKFSGYTIISNEPVSSQKNDNRVKLEDPEFNKEYYVYSTDQIEARFLITPAFMNRLLKMKKNPKFENITVSFERGKVNLAIHSSHNWFEINYNKSAKDISVYREILLELTTIFSLIDALKFDQNIGM